MTLPEKLRNLGIQPPPTEKVRVVLTESKVRALDEVFSTLLDKEAKLKQLEGEQND